METVPTVDNGKIRIVYLLLKIMLTSTFVIKRDKHHYTQLAFMDTFTLFSVYCTTALLPNNMIKMETVRL